MNTATKSLGSTTLERTSKNGSILDNLRVSIKPAAKNRPYLPATGLDKEKPLDKHNFPGYSYAYYWVYGYREDAAGVRRPFCRKKQLPCGQRIRLDKREFPPDVTITHCERAVGGPRLY